MSTYYNTKTKKYGTVVDYDIKGIGDISIYRDDDGNFDGADYICCGEWITYTADEKDDVQWILNKYGIKEEL